MLCDGETTGTTPKALRMKKSAHASQIISEANVTVAATT